jgi:hypothetical protein
VEKVIILEAGMKSGATSLAFLFQLPDNRVLVCETSAKLMLALAEVVQAAELRFKLDRQSPSGSGN